MSEPKRPLKVFLCHAHADRDPVRGLYTRLTQAINGLASGQADNNGQNPFKSVCPFQSPLKIIDV